MTRKTDPPIGTAPTRSFKVTIWLEVDGDATEELVEEAVTSLLDEEIFSMKDGGTRCGVRFYDASDCQIEADEYIEEPGG